MENEKVEEHQILEQNLQNLLVQKQTFQIELSETSSALREIENSKDEIFKIVGQLMIRTDKEKTKDELSNREKILEMRLKSIEKQEDALTGKLEKLRDEFIASKNN
ncbi:MAG TPA: prefoldin subunit beta [Candidatus Nanoarchaeia archaeon]|nr:prefoldin subunit beta [Candidatus Nanoarchaeia archaeon]